jgi:hypothetical protein
MKIENFKAVAELIKEREYVEMLRGFAALDGSSLRIMSTNNRGYDIRSDLVKKIVPEMKLVFTQQIAIIDEKLAAFGVAVAESKMDVD